MERIKEKEMQREGEGKKEKVDVSIIIPTLNEEKYIEGCLKSVAGQVFKGSYEIIIADGVSEDRTVEIARKYTDRIVLEKNRTIAAGRQAGARIARGDILAYAGADVIIPKNWLEKITAPFSDPNVVAVAGKAVPLDGNIFEDLFCSVVLDPAARVLALIRMVYVYGDNLAMRRSAFDKCGGFNVSLVTGEDTDVAMRIAKFGRVVYTSDAVVYCSMRRIRKWGHLYYLAYHTTNFFRTHLFGSSHGKYEPVRS
jgi:glycosyltransferase involved in cell wall biosynthesis